MKSSLRGLLLWALLLGFSPAYAADSVTVVTTQLTPQLYLLQGKGGNVLASVGPDGVLLIDNDYAGLGPIYRDALAKLGAEAPDYVINTHWHGDHTGNNDFWRAAGATVVAQDNVRLRMSTTQRSEFFGRDTPPSPPQAWPTVTYANVMALHVNADTVELRHYARGHTDGDSVVFFARANVVHMGDLFFKDSFPFVDYDSGGAVTSYIRNIEAILARTDDKTVIVPGHGGKTATRADLMRYHDMMRATRAEVQALAAQGLSLEQMLEQGLTAVWADWGKGFINQENWIRTLHASLAEG
ncbi:MBL fold metallo-hydrolase [Halieaceae bacterium IMCC14734]|uniref:MBL fold metallo-hydrolase n=1 Tax=Candidatus Litorirhabdus singularis TaxID=2518993 RepID=A0ABT3TB37_9GAMM|nr:MBL fold metallo-hydrolase [Candidatus Litorirhabdus singularis]MCX2979481.1 MBL fold metallo-hydrolase [Candidatus Litorirhabdus singularis]